VEKSSDAQEMNENVCE